jgi:hypothetical protein
VIVGVLVGVLVALLVGVLVPVLVPVFGADVASHGPVLRIPVLGVKAGVSV